MILIFGHVNQLPTHWKFVIFQEIYYRTIKKWLIMRKVKTETHFNDVLNFGPN